MFLFLRDFVVAIDIHNFNGTKDKISVQYEREKKEGKKINVNNKNN